MNNNMFFIDNNGSTMKLAIGYNEKKKSITAVPITIIDGVEVKGRTINNLDLILELLYAFSRQSKNSILELVNRNSIVFTDNRLLGDGVIIVDKSGEYNKIFFDKESGSFKNKTLYRKERIELGLLDKIDDLEENMDEVIAESHENVSEVLNENREFTDDVEPLVKNEELNTVNGSEHTDIENSDKSEKQDTIDKSNNVIRDKIIETKEKIVNTTKETIKNKVTETKETIKNIDVSNKKTIKGLKICAGALALIAAGVILSHNYGLLFKKNNNNNTRNDDNNNPRYEDSIGNTGVLNEVDEPVYINNDVYEEGKYRNYGSEVVEEDMETQLNIINTECFTFEPRVFDNIVIDSDKQTLHAIGNARNNALTDKNNVTPVIDSYVKYVFEGSTMFDGNVVKAYDYLSPYAKYIVLVSGESLLSLCPDYNYSTVYNEDGYYFESLIDEFDNLIDQTYRELTGKSVVR